MPNPDVRQTDEVAVRKPRRWLRWASDIGILLLLLWGVQWWQSRDLPSDIAPPLLGYLIDGKAYQLDPGDGPTLVHFWAEWCPICRLEEQSIATIAEDHRVITVATTSGSAVEVEAYLRKQGLDMPVLLDEDGDIARSWRVRGVPATFVVDRSGHIRSAGMGYSTELGLRFRLWRSAQFGAGTD